jgi:lipopolysaccharide export LptBFGC system permease protein LptF
MTVDLVRIFILQQDLTPEAERSPQERPLAELDRHIARMRAEREARVKADAPFQEVEKLEATIHASEVDRHLKVALPAYALPLMALGLAFGTLLARRKPVPVWLHVLIGFGTTFAIYTAMSVGRASLSLHDAPELAAWGPLLLPTIAAGVVWAYAVMTRQGAFADV